MFVQAWNTTGINIPLIHYFFGIDPAAYNKEILIRPRFPAQWGYAQLKDLLIGSNRLSVQYRKNGRQVSYKVLLSEPGWNVRFHLPEQATSVKLNGRSIPGSRRSVVMKDRENIITCYVGNL